MGGVPVSDHNLGRGDARGARRTKGVLRHCAVDPFGWPRGDALRYSDPDSGGPPDFGCALLAPPRVAGTRMSGYAQFTAFFTALAEQGSRDGALSFAGESRGSRRRVGS
jgi:hypothetical protein